MVSAQRHLIKKYANRKLYDTQTSRYITLEGIAELVRDGEEIHVVDRDTGQDLTQVILSQIVLSAEKRAPARARFKTAARHCSTTSARRSTCPATSSTRWSAGAETWRPWSTRPSSAH